MPAPKDIPERIARLQATLRHETDDWNRHEQDLPRPRLAKAVQERTLRQRMTLLSLRFGEERRRLEMDEARKIGNFEEFLDSIDAIKADLLACYTAMPRAMALLIHHHAAELLKEAWHSPSAGVRQRRQARFTDFMLTIAADFAALENRGTAPTLPERTLAFVLADRPGLPRD